MNLDRQGILIDLFRKSSGVEDKVLMSQLISSGFDNVEAEKYTVFTPIAFGRFFLNNRYDKLEFNDFYFYKNRLRKKLLVDDEIYIWAYNLSVRNSEDKLLSDEEYISIITRSPEIKSSLKAIKLKKNISGAKFKTILNIGFSLL